MFTNPPRKAIEALLRQVHSIAVVGLSPNAKRPSHRVAEGLLEFGYEIIPVRAKVTEVLGRRAYPSLRDLPVRPDLVDVFRASEHVDAIVKDCLALSIPALWLQDGVIDEAAALRAQAAGMTVVMDRCIWRDRMQFA